MIKLWYISNYGNEQFIINELKKNNIKIGRAGIKSGFLGCDPPYYMEVYSTKETICDVLKNTKTPDTWGV